MSTKLSKDQLAAMLIAFDNALADGPWTDTKFLSLIGQKLHRLRDEVFTELEHADDTPQSRASRAGQQEPSRFAAMKKVYIALYAFDGSNLESWARIVSHLPNQVTSRPVYEKEEDAIANISNKSNRINEAYAIVYVDPRSILTQPPERVPKDKLGKPLLVLKDNAVQLDNFEVLMHESGIYRYVSGRLISK
jgi:intracellular multiplication protein IcmQ